MYGRNLLGLFLVAIITVIEGQFNTYWTPNKSAIVHLFEWKFKDIAEECENFLAPNGYAGVQTSPVNEYLVSTSRAWWERYQPVSYNIFSRSGNEDEFLDMTKRCNAVGVRIYVDVVFNHMAAPQPNIIGTGGSTADPLARDFPAVPYTREHFNPSCLINDYNDIKQVRNCELVYLPDLNQTHPIVRDKIICFLNSLIDLGVAGFRVDACKHMWPGDLTYIFSNINNLSVEHGFPENTKPFIYQEVIDLGQEKIGKNEYNHLGVVTEFLASSTIGEIFHGKKHLNQLINWGPVMGFLPSYESLIFVDNHDNQRGHGAGGDLILTYKVPKLYKMATAFILSHTFGIPRLMSSYDFSDTDQGPPQDDDQNIISPTFDENSQCNNGWVCEHRWNVIKNIVQFRNIVAGTNIENWLSHANNQIAFCRGNKGFIAFNNDANEDFKSNVYVCVPPGNYCDVISGEFNGTRCSGKVISVSLDHKTNINIPANDPDGMIAIHIGAKLN